MPSNLPIANEFTQQLAERGYSPEQSRRKMQASMLAAAPEVRRPAAIMTQGLRQVDLICPDVSQIQLDDIAHGLSSICRFSGQTNPFWSVAQHSILVASLVRPELRLRALLHDASKAYIQDLPTPLKALLPEYQVIETRLMQAIHRVFRIPHNLEADAEVRAADSRVLQVEKRDLFPPALESLGLRATDELRIQHEDCLLPQYVAPIFIQQCLEAYAVPSQNR